RLGHGTQADSLLQDDDRFRRPPQLNEGQSQVVVNLSIGGPKFQGPLESRYRLLRFFLVHQHVAQVVIGFGVIGLESERLPQANDRDRKSTRLNSSQLVI